MEQTFIGVQRSPSLGLRSTRSNARPFKAQLVARGHHYYLGSYATAEEAADAYDNCAYWMGLEGYKYRALNFPDNYAKWKESTPPPTIETQRALSFYREERESKSPREEKIRPLMRRAIVARNRFVQCFDDLAHAMGLTSLIVGNESLATSNPQPIASETFCPSCEKRCELDKKGFSICCGFHHETAEARGTADLPEAERLALLEEITGGPLPEKKASAE